MNTKHIELVFTGPPQMDIGQLVKVIDDAGNPIDREIGGWYHDGQYWRFQIPVELVPRLVVPSANYPTYGDVMPAPGRGVEGLNAAQEQRRKLKEKVMSARAEQPSATSEDLRTCPNCKLLFDPRKDDLLECPECLEMRCTAVCLPDPAGKCLDCQATEAEPEEGGYDPNAKPGVKIVERTDSTEEDDDKEDDDEA